MVKTFKELGSIMAKEEKSAPIINNISKSKDDLIVEAILNTIRDAGLETDKEVTDEVFTSMTLPATLKHSVEILVEIGDSSLTIITRKSNKVLTSVAKWLRKLEENSNND
jgi:hypothetical protein